ncbi:uncharacterized protein LOC119642460 [Glossina fuscipes]|uniref:Uncharacterized protein LOC119642460 n=1 Tax=Glossina fuscipes TaxID=7396 RepID=A0A9C5ZJQ8_9MUSC|nr:uncharacterized protein LOC119642460 [Glossina fuscipes]
MDEAEGFVLVRDDISEFMNVPNAEVLPSKIFDVALNRRHVIVSQLDIFAEVGHGTAHHEYIFFTVNLGKLKYKEKVSNLRNNLQRRCLPVRQKKAESGATRARLGRVAECNDRRLSAERSHSRLPI